MDDREIVSAMKAGALTVLAGLAGAYDKYAAPLYNYCCWLLGEPGTAAEVVRDTLLLSITDLRAIRNPELLRPHLYAVARDECRQRRQTATAAASGPCLPTGSSHADLRGFILGTVAKFDDREREVVELVFRHGLSHADLAIVLGIPQRRASALATQVQGYLEDSLAVSIVAHTGAQTCPDLNEVLSGWDGHLTLWKKGEVENHIEECPICTGLRYQSFHPAIVYALESPTTTLPANLRSEVVGLCLGRPAPGHTERGEVSAPAGGHAKLGALLAFAAITIWMAAAVSVTLLTVLGSHSPHGSATVRTSRPPLTAAAPR